MAPGQPRDNSVTARLDQLSPEQIIFAKGAAAGTFNLFTTDTLANRFWRAGLPVRPRRVWT